MKSLKIVGILLAGAFAPQAAVRAIAQAWHRPSDGRTQQDRNLNSSRKEKKMMKKVSLLIVCTVLFALMGLCQAQEPSGTVTIDEYELAYIFNGTMGGGKLYFQGNTYDFKIGGLGIGGIGAAHISAVGEVYNLQDISAFPGAYGQAGIGFAATNQGQGQLWLQNQNGVQLRLRTSQQGLGLTTGADGIVINMSQ